MAVVSAPNSSDILELCLQAIERGDATIAQCVARYPGVEGLREMLQVAMTARTVPRPIMSLTAKKALEQQLVARMNTAKPRPERRRVQHWLRLPLTVAAMLVLLLGTGFGLARAAENTLPGDPLYGIKRASEQVDLLFADAPSRPAVLTHIAEARLTEIAALAGMGRSIDESLVADAVHSLGAAAAESLDPGQRAALFSQAQHALDLVAKNGNSNEAASLSSALNNVATPTRLPAATPTMTPTAVPTETAADAAREAATAQSTAEATAEASDTPTPYSTPPATDAVVDTTSDQSSSDPLAATRRGPKKTPPVKPTQPDKGSPGGGKGNMGGVN